MGSKVGRLPARLCAEAIVQGVKTYVDTNPEGRTLKRIVLSGYSGPSVAAYINALDQLYQKRLVKAALVIVDMINPFVGNGTLITEQQADQITGTINRLIDVSVDHKLPIVYVKDVHISSDRELVYVHQHCIKNPDEVPLHHKLAVHDSNATIVNKNTYSAFFGNDFADKLRALACETVLFTGTQTHVCVKYSALHAMMHGFRPVVLADSTVSSTDERHRMGLDEIARYIGEVSHSAYIINAISEAQE